MVVARIIAVAFVIILGALIGAWTFSGERRYLRYAWEVARVGLLAIAIFIVLIALERVI